jgi:hypothetical protein
VCVGGLKREVTGRVEERGLGVRRGSEGDKKIRRKAKKVNP